LLIRQILLSALVLILAVPAWGQGEKGVGVVTALTGKADLKRPQAPEAPLKLRDYLFVRDVVDTQKESLARILLMGKSSVTVRELSRLELREETRPDGARRVIIDLAEGKIRVMVARRLMKPGDEVQIRTPNAIAAVRGSDGIIEATTLPDGRPQTSVLVSSGVFEVTAPSTRPIAMAETISDAPSGLRLAQGGGLSLGGGNPNFWVAAGPPGLQQVVARFAFPNEVNAAIQLFTLPGGVASGTGVGQDGPSQGAILATMEALTQIETLRSGRQPAQGRGTRTPRGPDVQAPRAPITAGTETPTPPPFIPGGPFDQLSLGNQRIALALFNAQVEGPPSLTLTVDEIAELKQTLGWGEIFKLMQSRDLIKEEKKNLGQAVSVSACLSSACQFREVFDVLDFVNSGTNGKGRSCAHGACRQGIGPGSACAGGACAGGPPGGPPGGGPPCGTPPCGGKP